MLPKNSFGKGHRCCRPFPPNKSYMIPFPKLISCALLPGVRIPEGPPPPHSPVLTLRVPTVRARRTSVGLSLSHHAHHNMISPGVGIQTFPVPPNNFILSISSFCQAEKLLLKLSRKVTVILKSFFPVCLWTGFATSIPPSQASQPLSLLPQFHILQPLSNLQRHTHCS